MTRLLVFHACMRARLLTRPFRMQVSSVDSSADSARGFVFVLLWGVKRGDLRQSYLKSYAERLGAKTCPRADHLTDHRSHRKLP